MRTVVVVASTLLIALVVRGQDDLQCRVSGECFEGDFSDETLSPSYSECQRFCLDEDFECSHFTYYTSDSICITFSDCPVVDDSDCSDCTTGERECPEDPVCDAVGQCSDGADFVDTLVTEDRDGCLQACRDDDLCYWYEYDLDGGVCVLTENCPTIDVGDCPTCVVGEASCGDPPSTYDYLADLFFIGGIDDPYDVEVINMDPDAPIQLPCFKPAPTTIGFDQHVGTFSQGYPFACGGDSTFACQRYDVEQDVWETVQVIDLPRRSGSSSMLSETEWWITGGDVDLSNEGTTATIIYHTDELEWEPYVDLPVGMWRHNMVTVDEDTVFFWGGTPEQQAWLFDVRTEQFELLESVFDADVYLAYAGLVITDDRRREVVVTDGAGQGLNEGKVAILDVETRTWRNGTTNLPTGELHSGPSVPYGETFIIAGRSNSNQMFIWDRFAEEFRELPQVKPTSRQWESAVPVPPGFVQCF